MRGNQRLQLLLGLLGVVLAGVGVRWLTGSSPDGVVPSTRGRAAAVAATGAPEAPDVHLDLLGGSATVHAGASHRNLFRYVERVVVAPKRPARTTPAPPPPPPAPTGPPPLPPIPFRLIGVVEEPGSSRRLAMLADARGLYQGREGDIIEGRYRVVRIGTDSVEMAYLDGRGRQSIRLSGS